MQVSVRRRSDREGLQRAVDQSLNLRSCAEGTERRRNFLRGNVYIKLAAVQKRHGMLSRLLHHVSREKLFSMVNSGRNVKKATDIVAGLMPILFLSWRRNPRDAIL